MSKVENKAVKEYLIKFVLNDLDNCPLFKRVFGKNFARENLELNLERVYTNEFSLIRSGYMDGDDLSITICTDKENDTILSIDDIEKRPHLKATIMHETLHAILSKSKVFCRRNKIKVGTGILERYENGKELGRGLNEGLTNWITEKTGNPIYSYKELTRYIKMIELARGEKKVMKMARGNISRNVIDQLGMKKSEALSFLSLADEIYSLGDTIVNAEAIIRLLNMKDDKNARRELDENEYYNAIINIIRYKQSLKGNNLNVDTMTQIAYFEDTIERTKEELRRKDAKLVGIIYEKYFKKELKRLENKKDISITDDLEPYDYMSRNKLDFPGMEDFKEKYDKIDSKYFQKILKEVQLDYEKGELTGIRIKGYEVLTNRNRYNINVKFFNRIAKMINPKNPNPIQNLLCLTYIGEDIENINQYSVLEIKAENKIIYAYKKDGQVVDFHQFYKEKTEPTLDEIMYYERIRKKAKDMYPNANIRIIDTLVPKEDDDGYVVNNQERLVVCEEKGKEMYYIVEGDNLILANLEKEETKILNSPKRNKSLIITQEDILFSKIIKSIRRNLPRNTYCDIDCEAGNIDKHKTFQRSISDMSQYSQNILGGEIDEKYSEPVKEKYNNRGE